MCSQLLLCYKPVQHVTVLSTVGNCNTLVSIIILYYKLTGPPSYMQSVTHQNVIKRRMTVIRGSKQNTWGTSRCTKFACKYTRTY
jgi:hypothetical protein